MFGNNPVLKKSHLPEEGFLLLRELFPTIQGEGPLAGTPATFVRLGGCNLRCTFCDTDFDTKSSSVVSVENIVSDCIEFGNRLVVLTGGEPMMQEIAPLIRALRENGMQVQIETAGTVWPESLLEEDLRPELGNRLETLIVVSPKTPKLHPRVEANADAYKYLISTFDDHTEEHGIPITNTQAGEKSAALAPPSEKVLANRQVYLQPMEEYYVHEDVTTHMRDGVATQANVELAVTLCMKHGHKLSLQLHKILNLR